MVGSELGLKAAAVFGTPGRAMKGASLMRMLRVLLFLRNWAAATLTLLREF